jgi:hypothetical protein
VVLLAGLLLPVAKISGLSASGCRCGPGPYLSPAVEGLSTAAYAGIANDWWDAPITSNWEWGSIRGGDSIKGGGGLNDQYQMDRYEQFYLVAADNNGAGDFGFPVHGYGHGAPFPDVMLPKGPEWYH